MGQWKEWRHCKSSAPPPPVELLPLQELHEHMETRSWEDIRPRLWRADRGVLLGQRVCRVGRQPPLEIATHSFWNLNEFPYQLSDELTSH